MKSWHGLVLDGLVAVCITVLAGLRVVPGEAAIGILGAMVGARAIQRVGGGGDPPVAGGTASGAAKGATGAVATSAVLAILIGLGSIMLGRRGAA